MISRKDLKQRSENLYELSKGFYPHMRVPARLYADEELLALALKDRSLEQLANTASLPGVVSHTLAMPDMHQGYGFPIGGVAATELPHGVISPGGVGYDINCGVRLLSSQVPARDLANAHGHSVKEQFDSILGRTRPSTHGWVGLGHSSRLWGSRGCRSYRGWWPHVVGRSRCH